MLAVSPLRNGNNESQTCQLENFSMDLLDTIDFDDFFLGISDGDSLPDLEMDPEILAEFSVSNVGHEELKMNITPSASVEKLDEDYNISSRKEDEKTAPSVSASDVGSGTSSLIQGDEIVSKREEHRPVAANPGSKEAEKGKKSSAQSKNPPGKRKVKVDWTPELHRRFVQAVEQLGVDKAVPSRILEIMGIDCLTRHNIASHLQKYRSHRKHLLAREAEAANWSQRRQMYGTGKRNANPLIAPTMGFPPVAPSMPHFRPPLHVWGHPSVDQSLAHMWPKHLAPSPPPPPHAWPGAQPLLPADPSFWHSHGHHVPMPGTPCYPPHLPPTIRTRFPTPPVPGIPPPPAAMYKIETGQLGHPTPHPGQTLPPQPPCDVHPSKEKVDAAIGDVLSKPWLPLPLGLKPPSMDTVMVELQLQGISKIPPTCTTTTTTTA